jgi:hypothetical protein
LFIAAHTGLVDASGDLIVYCRGADRSGAPRIAILCHDETMKPHPEMIEGQRVVNRLFGAALEPKRNEDR